MNYDDHGLVINEGASNNVIQGNLIGTDASGMNALLNNGTLTDGIGIFGTSNATTGNLIGGLTPGAGNVISGLTADGVQINGATASNNIVQGNFIGVAADGVAALGNVYSGVDMYGGANSNLISSNIIGNNGSFGVGGVYLYYATNNLVFGNTIYSNLVSGVMMIAGPNVISENSIYGNGGLGIDNGSHILTPNTLHGHSNYPILTSVRHGCTDIAGCLDGTPGCLYQIEFYYNDAIVGLQNLQLQNYIGAIQAPSGPFQASFPAAALDGKYLTATATAVNFLPETSQASPGILTTPASTPVTPPTIALSFSNAFQEVLDADFFSYTGGNLVVKFSDYLVSDTSLWENVKVLPAMATHTTLDHIFSFPQGFYVVADIGPVGDFKATFVNPDGSPMSNAPVRVGRLEMPVRTDANGNLIHDGYPAGPVSVVLEKKTTVSNGVSTTTNTNQISYPVNIRTNSSNTFVIKAAIAAGTNTPPAGCDCTPWCAMMAGVVDGVEQLEISGGANGSCAQNVQITPPSGLGFTLGAGQTLLERPAADGTWTVTSTVCGQSETVQITLP